MKNRFEQLYQFMLNNGDLKFVPKMAGNWEEDKDKFTKYQIKIEEVANLKDIDFE